MTKELPAQTEQVHQWEAKLRMALDAAHMSIWTLDIQNHQITSAINLEALFGLEKDSFNNTYEAILNCIHTQDRDFFKRVHQQANENEGEFEIEYRVVLADDSIRWLVSKGVVWQNSSGVAVQMCAVEMDITKRKQDEAELKQQNLQCQQQTTLTQLFANITLKIRQSLQIDEILDTSVTEVQKLLQADRVLILQLHSNRSFLAVKEAVVPGLPVVLGQRITDSCFADDYIYQQYCQGRISAISDIETAQIQLCHLEFLQQFAVKANLVVPIFQTNQLWGLIIAHQCLHTREWTDWEIELLRQLADQIGIALAQSLILEKETNHRQELIRSNEELQQFAFIASHDLQEPLRKIRTFGDLLKVSCRDSLSTQGYDYLERMQKAALRMQTLIDDLLTLSRVTTKAQPFTSVNLAEIAQEVLSDLEVRIQQTGGRVEIGDLPIIPADPLQMRQLLQNLIGNALKFHRQNEPPVVRIYSQFLNNNLDDFEHNIQHFQIIVEDNGIGLPEKYLDRIFQIFQRLHSRTEYEGTGIGLAICRKITERHHGSIKAQSTPGQGAKFIVTLPIKIICNS
ncbi:ATP-binding protein [Anabaena catenula]|uniref:histidine kinase n=1 Tax=Anabaena catenula FACHB-362 TaxID=2692877 RepID=A0ABR8IZM1_9NOST|nr:GAF domain-containing protein [Anabaena catenula FACHB-362]